MVHLVCGTLGSPGGRAVRWVVGSGCDRCGRLGAPHGSALSSPPLQRCFARVGARSLRVRRVLLGKLHSAMGWRVGFSPMLGASSTQVPTQVAKLSTLYGPITSLRGIAPSCETHAGSLGHLVNTIIAH